MIVADTNLIAYLLLPSEHREIAERVADKDLEWNAPVLWRSEFNNILTIYMRQGIMAFDDALATIQQAEGLIEDREHQISSNRVLALANNSTCSAYDCEFVALAQELGVPLVTADRRVLSNFPNIAVSIEDFAA